MRIYHLDLKVSMFQASWLKTWLKKLRGLGYGGVCIEIDNKLIFPSHPEFAAPDALSADQWHELIRYGKSLGLLVYPLIQTLGHMEHVLAPATPMRRLAEAPGNAYMFCPSKPATITFVRDLIRDAHAVFDRPDRIHLGGDECRLVGMCPHCLDRSLPELLSDYMGKLHAAATALGMQAEFWADMVLAHPQTLDVLPKDIRFVDWLYNRTEVRGADLKHCWGYRPTAGLTPQQLLAGLPPDLEPERPFLVNGDGACNAFYGSLFLKARGYDVVVSSGVRFAGDSYALPRTRTNILNVGATQQAAEELDADHLVTSWAIRLSHPETTWPGMLSARIATDDATLASLGASIGGLDRSLLADLDTVQAGIDGIDILAEPLMRFQRPFYGDWLGHVRNTANAPDAAVRIARIWQRAEVADKLLPLFQSRLAQGVGDRDALRHWLCGLRLCRLRARQFLAVIERRADLVETLRKLIEENRGLMGEFAELWSESLTPHSLENELEVKFRRDIRVLQEIIG